MNPGLVAGFKLILGPLGFGVIGSIFAKNVPV
jgi:hypothetical protein